MASRRDAAVSENAFDDVPVNTPKLPGQLWSCDLDIMFEACQMIRHLE